MSSHTTQLGSNLKLQVRSTTRPTRSRQLDCRGTVNTAAQDTRSRLTSSNGTIPTLDTTKAPASDIIQKENFREVRLETVSIDGTQLLNFLKSQGTRLKKLELIDTHIQLDSVDWDDDDEPYPFLTKFLQLLQHLEVDNLEMKHVFCSASKRPHSRQFALDGRKWSSVKEVRIGFADLIAEIKVKRHKENMQVQKEACHSKPQSSFIENESWDDEYGFGAEDESDEDPYVHDDDGDWNM